MDYKRSWHSDASRSTVVGCLDTISTNCGCPSRTLESLQKRIHHWIWIPCPLLWREPLLFKFFPLQYSPYSVVYDPTAFMACKLVIVAWLKAYGAATKLRAPCGTAATWWRCSARAGIEVVDQVPLPSYAAVPLLLQNILLGNIWVFEWEIHDGLMK